MAVERTGVYPGTFDPITSGHMEIVRRSLRLVDKLVIGPAMSISKGPMFSLEERIDIIKDDIADFPQADRDRIEIYRPLIADPKEVRRKRAEEGKVMKKGGGPAEEAA